MSTAATPAPVAPTPDELTSKALTWPQQARALAITDQYSLEQAAVMIKGIKDLRAEVHATFDPVCDAAFRAHREATAARKKAEDPLIEAEGILNRSITTYQIEQERIRQEEARKAREEAARIEREQREQFEAEQRRLQEEARREEEERRLADALQAEAENASPEEVAAILEQPSAIAPLVVAVPPPPPPVAAYVPPPVSRPAGISKPKDNWSAEVVDKAAFLAFVAANPMWFNLVEPSAALGSLARTQKELFNIPGVRAINKPSVSVRR
jgi:hypothetical protein